MPIILNSFNKDCTTLTTLNVLIGKGSRVNWRFSPVINTCMINCVFTNAWIYNRRRTPEISWMGKLPQPQFHDWNMNIYIYIYTFLQLNRNHSFIHSAFCLTTGPKPLPKRFLHIVRSRASSFKWEYPLLFLRSSSSFLRLLPRLLVTSISPFIFPSITCFRRQFLLKMWPIQLSFIFLNSCRTFLCLFTLSNTSSFEIIEAYKNAKATLNAS
jgi:hypothetical protein